MEQIIKLPSKYQIGDIVSKGSWLDKEKTQWFSEYKAKVVAVRFTEVSILYDVLTGSAEVNKNIHESHFNNPV